MKSRYLLLAAAVGCGAATADESTKLVTEKGVVKVVWQDTKKFRDVESSGDIQSRFEERLFNALTKHLNKEAQKLFKPDQKLELVVTDLDLAGDMRPTFGASVSDLRIVKDIYPPRMSFSYKLLDGKRVVIAGDEKLIDMNFLGHVQAVKQDSFPYETRMLSDWLKSRIQPML
jgi:hypothetical protein